MYLAKDTTLQEGKYKIERMLAQGGFGITYLGIQCKLERKVAIKEFFMKDLCERVEDSHRVTLGTKGSREMVSKFRSKFLKEARNIARLKHQHIVRIIDVFEENGTAYYVMEYAENGSLADKLYLSEAEATRYILQVASALDYIHQQKITHLDIKPANIMLNENDDVVLIDFGLSKQYDAETGEQTSTTPVGISKGYAPMEQYNKGGVGTFSPATDVYSLGATYLKLLTGVTPPSAIELINGDKTLPPLPEGISKHVCECIEKAMTPQRNKRMQSVAEFMQMLGSEEKASPEAVVQQKRELEEATKIDNAAKEEAVKPVVNNVAKKEPPVTSGTNGFVSTLLSILRNVLKFIFGAFIFLAAVAMLLDRFNLLKLLQEWSKPKPKFENKHNPLSINPQKRDTIRYVPKHPLSINNQ